ncbi:MAG: hypothetical protein PHY92_05660, partial [Alphaproteobacteria bacterium]|nr:hypothetical protein [Alphaproteobacteria bacterium]
MPKKVPPGLFDKETLIAAIKRDLKAKGRRANFDTALAISSCVFHGCRDRNHQPIADHYLQVFHSGTLSKTKKMVGILHDVVEDTDWTLDDLREVGFPEKVVRAVGYV